MYRQMALRLAVGLLTLWAVSIVVFLATTLLPGDAVQAALGQYGSNQPPALIESLKKEFGLDKPLATRYSNWLTGFVQGDLGRSLPSGTPVTEIIADKGRNTAALVFVTTLVLIPVSVGFGIAAAMRGGRALDHGITGVTLGLVSMPEFVVGTLLAVIFAVWLGILPPVSLVEADKPILGQLEKFVLPMFTLLAAISAQTIRMVRATVLEVLDAEYIQMARLKGVPELHVLWHHALPNALAPVIQILAINIAWLVGGIVVVETVFQFPGMGLSLTGAVASRDLPTVEALAMLITLVYLGINLTADVLVIALNPRLRRRRK